MMNERLESIARKVRAAERIAPAEALALWEEAPLWLLAVSYTHLTLPTP